MKAFFFLTLILSAAVVIEAQLQWRRLHRGGPGSNVPAARRDCVIGYDERNEQVYMFGGRGNGKRYNDVWKFNLTGLSWELDHPGDSNGIVPAPRFSLVGGFYARARQFIITTGEGNVNGRVFFNDMWAYNVDSKTWLLLPPSGPNPEKRYGSTGGIYRNGTALYITHGFSSQRYSNTFRYDLEKLQWTEEFSGTHPYSYDKPHPRCLMGGTMVGREETVFFGGCLSGGHSGGPCPSVDSWAKQRGGSWRRMDDCASPRQFSGMAAWPFLSRTAVMFGGKETDRSVISVSRAKQEEVDFIDVSTKKWRRLATQPDGSNGYPLSRWSNAMISTKQGVFLFGGASGDENLNDVWMLSGNVSGASEVGSCGPKWFLFQHLHGFFMIISWGIVLQAGAFIARYFRQYNPLWFKLHQAIQISGSVLSLLGIILVLPGTRALPNFAHSVIGVLILLGSIQQVINGLCRPHKQEKPPQPKKRVYWEHWHKNIGRLLLVLAVVNISLGVFLIIAPDWVIAVWFAMLGIGLITYIVMEIRLIVKKRE